jgi:hypothetical protein
VDVTKKKIEKKELSRFYDIMANKSMSIILDADMLESNEIKRKSEEFSNLLNRSRRFNVIEGNLDMAQVKKDIDNGRKLLNDIYIELIKSDVIDTEKKKDIETLGLEMVTAFKEMKRKLAELTQLDKHF